MGQEHKLLLYGRGSKHPPYNELSVPDTLTKFCAELLPCSPFLDPRKKTVQIVKNNFPKLAGLQHRNLTRAKLPASAIVASIENGTFDPSEYDLTRNDRLRTLFWIPELISDPDAIYPNAHRIVEGDEVYVRVYDKMGSTLKLLFTLNLRKHGRIIRTVPVTSFLTDARTALSYVRGEPLYLRPQIRKPPEGG